MCFSAEADLVAGVAVAVVAVDAFRHIARPSDRLLAAIPAVLAAHQLIETAVWYGLEGDVSRSVWRPAMWVYLIIAFVVVPVLVPLAVAAVEPAWNRRRVAVPLAGGIAVAIVLFYALVSGPATARITGHHVEYTVDVPLGGFVVAIYIASTCAALLFSNYRYVRRYGLVNLAVVIVLVVVDRNALISLWCAWAAVTSIAIALHLRTRQGDSEPGGLLSSTVG